MSRAFSSSFRPSLTFSASQPACPFPMVRLKIMFSSQNTSLTSLHLAERFEFLVQLYKPSNKVPAFLTCVDIAGLTKGAASGAGLGNNFLSNVRAVDGIFQVVRESLKREGKAEHRADLRSRSQVLSTMPRLSTSRVTSTPFVIWTSSRPSSGECYSCLQEQPSAAR